MTNPYAGEFGFDDFAAAWDTSHAEGIAGTSEIPTGRINGGLSDNIRTDELSSADPDPQQELDELLMRWHEASSNDSTEEVELIDGQIAALARAYPTLFPWTTQN